MLLTLLEMNLTQSVWIRCLFVAVGVVLVAVTVVVVVLAVDFVVVAVAVAIVVHGFVFLAGKISH